MRFGHPARTTRAPKRRNLPAMGRLRAHPGPLSPAEGAKRTTIQRDRAIIEIAGDQHGIVTLAQLRAVGHSDKAIQHRVATARLHRLHRGIFAVGLHPIAREGHLLAATLACGPNAVLSHASLAALMNVRESSATLIDVTAPGRAGRQREGIRIHSANTLRPADRTDWAGIPCTTAARLIVDMAGVLRPASLEFLIHRIQTSRLFDRAAVIAAIAHAPGRPGTASVRRILGLSSAEEDEIRSEDERRLVRLCRAAGIPAPQCNRWIAVEGAGPGGFEVDACWPAQRVIVEVDSRDFHDSERAWENDRYRDRLLTLAGWTVIRVTSRDLRERPGAIARQLGSLLGVPIVVR
jgi:hypothetical protein